MIYDGCCVCACIEMASVVFDESNMLEINHKEYVIVVARKVLNWLSIHIEPLRNRDIPF